VYTKRILDIIVCEGYTTKVSKGVSIGFYTRKYSIIASGATTIGSAERAPDDIIIKNSKLKVTGGYNILEPILEKIENFFDYSLGGYYHREHWSRTRRCLFMSTGASKAKKEMMNVITTIGSEFFKSWLYNPNILCAGSVKQGCNI
jgi:hypothetical protein